MEVTDTSTPDNDPEPSEATPCVSVCKATPDRTVFTEEGNEDGWIATDYSVSLQR